jgi:hypothetical protein
LIGVEGAAVAEAVALLVRLGVAAAERDALDVGEAVADTLADHEADAEGVAAGDGSVPWAAATSTTPFEKQPPAASSRMLKLVRAGLGKRAIHSPGDGLGSVAARASSE